MISLQQSIGLKELHLGLSDREINEMFEVFDVDGSGSVEFEEFIQSVRDPLTQRRRDLVAKAFAALDVNGEGVVEPSHLLSVYDTSKHPEVIAGRMTPEQVMSEFLDTFDVGGEVDGKVSGEGSLYP